MMPSHQPNGARSTSARSAFPKPIEQLVEEAERLARELGTIPSQNRLKAALHVRAERAKAVLGLLEASGFDPTVQEVDTGAQRRLHSVREFGEPGAKPTVVDDRAHSGLAEPAVTPTTHRDSAGHESAPASDPLPTHDRLISDPSAQANQFGEPRPYGRPVRRWPIILLAAPAFVAIWSGWVGVGELAGFGPVRPLPGIADGFTINSAITLPIGMETYAAYALRVWLGDGSPDRARRFAKRSAIAAFVLGGLGQIAYHLMTAAHLTTAPWPITTVVSCLPVVVLGFGAGLAHLLQKPNVDRVSGASND